MGRVAVRTAASLEGIGEIVVADRDLASAESVAAEAGPSAKVKLRAERIDVTDSAALSALLGGAGAVLNTTGPFYKFALPILRAAIQTGTHYLDICDDWEPTIEMMRLNRSAAEAGVTAVIGLGASPGVSNLMAKMAAHELDEVGAPAMTEDETVSPDRADLEPPLGHFDPAEIEAKVSSCAEAFIVFLLFARSRESESAR